MKYAVVGGGITGLAAAWELRQLAPDADITVHEPGVLGGKLRTSTFAGRSLDEGADAFLARVPEGRDLCAELGLAGSLVSPATGTAFVAAGHHVHALPAGLVLGVPTDAAALAGSPLLDADAVERVAAEPSRPGAPLGDGDDPSIGALVRARFGDDVLERLVDPLLGSINAGDSDHLSLRAAAPQLAAAAERSASLVDGLRAAPPPDDPSAPVFCALPGGMATLVDALVDALRASGVTVVRDAVEDLDDLDGGGVVVAAPAGATARLLRRAGATQAASILGEIRHASPVLVSLAFRREHVRHPLDGSGLLVPKPERRMLTACSFASTKWAHLARPDTVVLRASAGRLGDDRAISMDDDVLVGALLHDLDELLGLSGDPVQVRVSRWRDGFPQYEPGHLDRVAAVEHDAAAHRPGVALAGAAYRGIGIPACIRQGRAAARVVVGGPADRSRRRRSCHHVVMRRRRAVALALLLPILAGCGAAVADDQLAAPPTTTGTTATTAAPTTTTTTTWPLSTPMPPPEEDYFDEPTVEIGRIAVPALGLDEELHQGMSLHNIDLGPSHWPGTALPGHLGDVVVAGHRVTRSRPFRDLDQLGAGDAVTFTTAEGTFTYEWMSTEVVTPDRVDIADQLPEYEATLYACHPPGSARERIVAHFRLVSPPAPGQPDPAVLPAARPAPLPAAPPPVG